jgi:hypothetical protein
VQGGTLAAPFRFRSLTRRAKKASGQKVGRVSPSAPRSHFSPQPSALGLSRPSARVNTRVIYHGDDLEQGKAAGGFSVNTADRPEWRLVKTTIRSVFCGIRLKSHRARFLTKQHSGPTPSRTNYFGASAPHARPQKTGAPPRRDNRLQLEWIACGFTEKCFWTAAWSRRAGITWLASRLRSAVHGHKALAGSTESV